MSSKRLNYEGLLDIPEGKVGAFEVRHVYEHAGAIIPTASHRTRLYGGHRTPAVTFDHPTRWHELTEGGGVWTSDRPIEQWQQAQSITGFRGRVLIGGLGLGVVVAMLKQKKNITRIDVVEKSAEVIELVGLHIAADDDRVRIHQADLFDFLWEAGARGERWNDAFFDIWTADSEHTFYEVVTPLRRLARPLVKRKLTNWNEDVMRGQVQQSLYSPFRFAQMGIDGSIDERANEVEDPWHARTASFYRGFVALDPRPDLKDEAVQRRLAFLAWLWAHRYDGTAEFHQRWVEGYEDEWKFAGDYTRQIARMRENETATSTG